MFVVTGREAHFVTGVAFVEEIGFAGQEVEEGVDELLDTADFLADGQVELVKPLVVHI